MAILFLLWLVDSIILEGHTLAAQLLNCRSNIFLVLVTLSKTYLVLIWSWLCCLSCQQCELWLHLRKEKERKVCFLCLKTSLESGQDKVPSISWSVMSHLVRNSALAPAEQSAEQENRSLLHKEERLCQSVAFPDWGFQFLSFPVVVWGQFALRFSKLVHLLEYCFCSSRRAISSTHNAVFCIRKVAEWCFLACKPAGMYHCISDTEGKLSR